MGRGSGIRMRYYHGHDESSHDKSLKKISRKVPETTGKTKIF